MQLDDLVDRFQQKDKSAFEQLYLMYSKSIHGVVFNIIRNQALAEEITQDVFIKVWQNSSSYSAKKGRFFTWVLNIARNTAIDQLRSKDYKQNKQNLDTQFFVDIIESQTNLNRKTDAIGISEFVKRLASKCKRIIELLYFKGYTQKEASKTLNIPIGTIKTHNRSCIKELRELLKIT